MAGISHKLDISAILQDTAGSVRYEYGRHRATRGRFRDLRVRILLARYYPRTRGCNSIQYIRSASGGQDLYTVFGRGHSDEQRSSECSGGGWSAESYEPRKPTRWQREERRSRAKESARTQSSRSKITSRDGKSTTTGAFHINTEQQERRQSGT